MTLHSSTDLDKRKAELERKRKLSQQHKLLTLFLKYANKHYNLNIFGVVQTYLNTKMFFYISCHVVRLIIALQTLEPYCTGADLSASTTGLISLQ